jgi:hypothetical protein
MISKLRVTPCSQNYRKHHSKLMSELDKGSTPTDKMKAVIIDVANQVAKQYEASEESDG